jgi:hypothetical protein
LNQLITDKIVSAGLKRSNLPRIHVAGYGDVIKLKEEIPVSLPDLSSLRDFGGCYIVHGRYLLHAARLKSLAFASMIDLNPLPEFLAAADALRADQPRTRIETIQGDFRNPSMFMSLKPTDAALLYEVLLHQENYMEVLRNVVSCTHRFVCIAQPCIREELFVLPSAAVLLQFYDEALKELLRDGSFWPKESRTEQFNPAFWMWGHTTSHLIDIMHGLGWGLVEGTVVDNVCGRWWEYPLLVFARQQN